MRKIKLTEQDLLSVIKESVYQVFKDNVLLEYAVSRKEFVRNVYNLSYQIIENWCLIHYCTLTKRTETKEHWKRELRGHMQNIMRDTISANNSQKTKLKAIKEGFNKVDLYNGAERILNIIIFKFEDEKIKIDKTVEQVALDCSLAIDDIANVLSLSNQENKIREYVDSI